ncbi:hypothetical protein BC834DRAFT_951693 [Gloeopeniophorella convolvens]|nr:hypothetical protein BC834DRAFT_951693 [Gloeopeniophorella convolvens]
MKPIQDLLPQGAISYQVYPNFYQFFLERLPVHPEIVGVNLAASSRLIPRHYFENDSAGLSQALRAGQVASGPEGLTRTIQVLVDTPAPSFNLNKTSTTPAWYNSLWHVLYTVSWNNTTPVVDQRQEVELVHAAGQALRDYAPDGGAYFNEADIYEPNHEESFWGADNAARLQKVKASIDPNGLFQVWQGVGWDGEEDPKYQCYAELNPGSAS